MEKSMRERQIEAVASVIAEAEMCAIFAHLQNARSGWSVEIDNGRGDGGWLRYDDVVLTDAEMETALRLAQEYSR